MLTMSKVYDSYAQAQSTVEELERAGIAAADVSLVANKYVSDKYDNVEESTATETGAGVGAAVGGGVGLLAGLGLLAIPGLGPVVAAGWLAATAVGAIGGAITGGLVGALVEAGVPEAEAHVYSEAVRRGGTMVTVRYDDTRDTEVRAIMSRWQPIDASERRTAYEKEGWKAFDASAPVYKPNESEIERMRRR